jgi:serine/threonine protein kinase
MQRVEGVQAVASSEGARCPGCEATVEGTRCLHCGVASRAGRYRVVRVLAQSPQGRMYEAEDDAGARVALKELAFAAAPSVVHVEAFEREARLLSSLDHPRVPRFVGSFQEGTGVGMRLYLAQQFVRGESLARRLDRGPLPESEVRTLAAALLEVLTYLHARQPAVLHRDIKPANVVCTPEGGYSLVDFGVARELAGPSTHNATLVGTYGYMPPEQLGGTVDARSDLFALGATLLHAATGSPPEGLSAPDGTPGAPPRAAPPPGLRRFLTRLVAVRPDQRFASAAQALAQLRTGISSERSNRWIWAAVTLAVAVAAAAWAVPQLRTPHPPQTPDTSVYRKPIQDPAGKHP